MGTEKGPTWLMMGAFPRDRVLTYIEAARKLEIHFEVIQNSDLRVSWEHSYMQARENEDIIRVEYGDDFSAFWNLVNKISPPPPPLEPIGKPADSEISENVLFTSEDQI